jgi:murein DD-endopeptidase MepM/ murein hydrolase activator NlpD
MGIADLARSQSARDGRYQLVTVAAGADGNIAIAEMLLMNPQGQVVWRGQMRSGNRSGAQPLPGLRADLGRSVTAEYPIHYDQIRTDRTDNGFHYADGSPGFSIYLQNASNMAEIGGAGRDLFRIHTSEYTSRDGGTHGCLGFVHSDASAREFLRIMQSLPASQRPASLKVLNPHLYGRDSEIPDLSEDARRQLDQLVAVSAPRNDSPGEKNIFETIIGFLRFLFGQFFNKDNHEAPREESTTPDVPDSPGELVRIGQLLVSSNALPRWEQYQRDHGAQPVTHSSPVEGDAVVVHPFGENRGDHIHAGVDIGARSGEAHPDIHPSAGGIVIFSGQKSGYGNTVMIGHADGTFTLYGHMSGEKMPALGAEVSTGDVIGVMSNTGHAKGIHLHYEQRAGTEGAARQPVIEGVGMVVGSRLTPGADQSTRYAAVDADPGDTPSAPRTPAAARSRAHQPAMAG